MDYRSPIAGLERQVEELVEELRALQGGPSAAQAQDASAEDAELATLQTEVERVERRAAELRASDQVRELTPLERLRISRLHSGGVLALVLGALVGCCLVGLMFVRARGLHTSFGETEILVAMASGMSAVFGTIAVLAARADARHRRAGRTAPDDFTAGD